MEQATATREERATGGDKHRREGRVTKEMEKRTAMVPSNAYLFAALGSMAASATLQIFGRQHVSLFVGQWAPAFLLMGIYNKIVKVSGSEAPA